MRRNLDLAPLVGAAIVASAALSQETPRDLVAAGLAIERARDRFVGELLDVELKPPKRDEASRAVYEVKLLTGWGSVIRIRIDAVSGDFLEAAGEDLSRARRPAGARPGARP